MKSFLGRVDADPEEIWTEKKAEKKAEKESGRRQASKASARNEPASGVTRQRSQACIRH
jgi:hypothetical protein